MEKPLTFIIEKNGQLELNKKVIEIIEQSYKPRLILFYGESRLGKSTTLNQIIRGNNETWKYRNNEPFESKTRQERVTIGCHIYGPIKQSEIIKRHNLRFNIKEDFDLFFCDTEGLSSLYGQSKELIPGILTLLQICSFSVIMINSNPNEESISQIYSGIQFSKLLKQINKDLQSPLIGIYISRFQIDISEYDDYYICKDEYIKGRDDTLDLIFNYIKNNYPNLDLERRNLKVIAGGPYESDFIKEPNHEDIKPQLYWDSIHEIVKEFVIHFSKTQGYSSNKLISLMKIVFDIFKNMKELPKNFDLKDALIKYINDSFDEYSNTLFIAIKEEVINNFKNNLIEYYKILNDDNEAINKLKIYIKEDMIDIYEGLIPNRVKDFMKISINELRHLIEEQFKEEFKNKSKEILSEKYINHYIIDIIKEIQKAQFQEDINNDIINNYNKIWNIIEKENKNLFIYFQNKNPESLEILKINFNNYIEKIIKKLISEKINWNTFFEGKKNIIEKEIKLKYSEIFRKIKYQEDINQFQKKSSEISEELFNNFNEFTNLPNNKKEEIIKWIQNSCEIEYKKLIEDNKNILKWENILEDTKKRIRESIKVYIESIFSGKNYKEEIDPNLGRVDLIKKQIPKDLINNYELSQDKKNIINNIINDEVNNSIFLFIKKREDLPFYDIVLSNKRILCEKIADEKIEELMKNCYYYEDKVKFDENDFLNLFKQNEEIDSYKFKKDEKFIDMLKTVSKKKSYEYNEILSQKLPKWKNIKENIKIKIQNICDIFIQEVLTNKLYKEEIEYDCNKLLNSINSLNLFDSIQQNKHEEIKNLINKMIEETKIIIIKEQNQLSKWIDKKAFLIEKGCNIMIEKSNNDLKTKDIKELINILINEVINSPSFFDSCKKNEQKNEILSILIQKAEIIAKEYIKKKINEENKELEYEKRLKEEEQKFENERNEKRKAEKLANEIKMMAQQNLLNMENEYKKRIEICDKELNKAQNVINNTIEYYPIPQYNGISIVDALKDINVNSSFEFREKIAAANNIENYEGIDKQNLFMLKLLKGGRLIKPRN